MAQPRPLSCTRTIRSLALAVLVAAPLSTARAHAANWPVFGHDPARTGDVAASAGLSAANVGRLRRRWTATFPDIADSTPIYLPRVAMSRGGTRSLLFQTTKHGTTYAVDAHSGRVVWHFDTPGPKMYPFSPSGDKITTSTPVADPSGRYVYVPGTDGQVHKLAAATGQEARGRGFPLRITLMPDVEKDASALNLANGYLYATTSGYIGDQGPYDGHVVALRLRDGATHVFNTLCSNIHHLLLDRSYDRGSRYSCPEVKSGMWARAGVVVDPDPSMHGRIYVATGNGLFNANRGGTDYGDTVLALSADASRLVGSFTPASYTDLDNNDADLGSTAPVMLPREPRSRTPLMAVQGGKDQVVRLLDRAHLGRVHGELQDVSLPGAVLFSQPAVWRDGGTTWVYVGDNSGVTALRLRTDARGVSRLEQAWSAPASATSPVVANGLVIVAGDGVLNALDARTGRVLWASTRRSAGGTIGDIHWESPIAVDRWVYISDESSHLTAYALPGR